MTSILDLIIEEERLKKQEEQQANAELIKQLKLLKNEERKLEKKHKL